MPTVRRIGIASTSPLAGHPPCRDQWLTCCQPIVLDGRESADWCLSGLSPTIRAEQVGQCEAKRAKTGLSTLLVHFPTHCELGAVLTPQCHVIRLDERYTY